MSAGTMIATSINMHADTHAIISRTAEKMGLSRRDVVVQLLMRVMHDVEGFQRLFTAVKYQPDNDNRGWFCFSIKYRPCEYEFFTDLRNFCKCSVSLLLAMAVEKYIAEIINEDSTEVINNTFYSNYDIKNQLINDVRCWIIRWVRGKNRKKQQLE